MDPTSETPLQRATRLRAVEDLAGAVAAFRDAILTDPKNVEHRSELAKVLTAQDDLRGAVATLREAVNLDPKSAKLRHALGHAFWRQNDLESAIAAFRAAAELDSTNASDRLCLGNLLRAKGDGAEAVTVLREAIRIDPRLVKTRSTLALALLEVGRADAEAVGAAREAVRLEARSADAHATLGTVLQCRGQFEEAVTSFKKAASLNPSSPEIQSQVRVTERWVALNRRLPKFLDGADRPTTAAEAFEIAEFCQQPAVRRYGLAHRLNTKAFSADSDFKDRAIAGNLAGLRRDRRLYKAACAAIALAVGEDSTVHVGADESDQLLVLARDWLTSDLLGLRQLATSSESFFRTEARNHIMQWWREPALIPVRQPDRLVRIKDSAERARWQRLWSDAENALAWSNGFETVLAGEARGDWSSAAIGWTELSRLTPLAPEPHLKAARFWTLARQPSKALPHLLWLGWLDPDFLRTPAAGNAYPAGCGNWKANGGEIIQSLQGKDHGRLWFGDLTWTDYDIQLEAMRVAGTEGFGFAIRAISPQDYTYANFGGWGNRFAGGGSVLEGQVRMLPGYRALTIEAGRWYRVEVKVRGNLFRMFLDAKEVFAGPVDHPRGGIALGTWDTANRFRNIKVIAPDGRVLFEGVPRIHQSD
jgi:Flp pilus assembly protein TadD